MCSCQFLLGLSFAIPSIDSWVGRQGRKRHSINLDRLLKNSWRKCELQKKGGKRGAKLGHSLHPSLLASPRTWLICYPIDLLKFLVQIAREFAIFPMETL